MKGEIFVYICAIVGTLAAFRRPALGLFVYIGFAMLRPQSLWAWSGDFGPISFIVGSATIVGWVFAGFGSWRFGAAKGVVALLLGFSAWLSLCAITAVSPAVSWQAIINLSKYVTPFVIGATLFTTRREARALMWLIVLAEGYVAYQINLTYYADHINTLQEYGFGGMDNNSFAISLVSTLGPAVALAVSPGKWWMRLLAAASAVCILHATLLSFSRGGMVGLCVAGVVAFIAMPKRPKYLLGLLLVAALAYRLTGKEIVARMDTMFVSDAERDGSSQSRLDLWRDCLHVTMTHPIFGIGPDNWPIVASSLGWSEGKQAHSAWMQAMAETGFVGMSLVLGFFSLTAFRMWRRVRIRGPSAWNDADRVLAAGIVTGMAGFIVSAQFVTILGLETPYYIVLVAVVLLRATDMVPVTQPLVAKSIPERGPKSRAIRPGLARPRLS